MDEVLHKILEKIKELKRNQNSTNQDYATGYLSALSTVEGIVSGSKENDDWIPVSERLPKVLEIVKVTVHSSEWISDNEKIYHPEKYNVYDGYIDTSGKWIFFDKLFLEYTCDETFGENKGHVYDVVTAWQPKVTLLPYKG